MLWLHISPIDINGSRVFSGMLSGDPVHSSADPSPGQAGSAYVCVAGLKPLLPFQTISGWDGGGNVPDFVVMPLNALIL